MTFREHKAQLMKDPEFKKEYDRLEPIYGLIRELIRYRIKNGLTQEELALRIGTKQSAISRLESTKQMPSLSFLRSVANALDMELHFRLIRRN
ncbi:MAG: transcriptional regulator [Ignavibacteria bacterium GWB2_35_12]|nr:MAG: transcriptional regulator [Ignavibacteria bacterium GWA2_35_8]OGU39746.1 MAG: transcriptional regulator [Ignavibacteria bacterium GWB2_35_12]OGU91228.1 MAG: transcriptional regulator [Ignavibacteria bacterium RIFOXYA2_FULL_35_10]OGV21363.1 MAG: transcriptional regulator [Ignavibacteria bacterium RIFOXYC2_FULL_35_21]